jgi:hypothetical protein
MEARATLSGTGISRGPLVAVIVALSLAAGAAVLAVEKSASTAAPAAHSAAITSGPSDPGSAWNYSVRRGGSQSVEGPAAPAPYRESHGY